MALRIPAASIVPDLRFGAADALADPHTSVLVGDVTPCSGAATPHGGSPGLAPACRLYPAGRRGQAAIARGW
jgi:hypothetical protein